MNFLELLRAFGFRGQEAEAPIFIRGFDSIPPEFASFKDQIRAAIGEDGFRVSPASTTRSPGTFDDVTRSVEAVLTTEQAVIMPDYERWEMVDEVLLMSGPFLDSHNGARAPDVIGSTSELRVEGDALIGKNTFSTPRIESDSRIRLFRVLECSCLDLI